MWSKRIQLSCSDVVYSVFLYFYISKQKDSIIHFNQRSEIFSKIKIFKSFLLLADIVRSKISLYICMTYEENYFNYAYLEYLFKILQITIITTELCRAMIDKIISFVIHIINYRIPNETQYKSDFMNVSLSYESEVRQWLDSPLELRENRQTNVT